MKYKTFYLILSYFFLGIQAIYLLFVINIGDYDYFFIVIQTILYALCISFFTKESYKPKSKRK